jgi:hypothetical protein
MNTTPAGGTPTLRTVRHNHLRLASWATVLIAIPGFLLTLIVFSLATLSCMGGMGVNSWCEFFNLLPLLCLGFAIGSYALAFWIIHELGYETQSTELKAAPASRFAWQHAKLGYKKLDSGHHRLVRRVHRVSSVAMAGLAAFVSFLYFEADTPANLVVAAIAFGICELLNWKTYPTLMKEDELRKQKQPAKGKS